MKGHMGRNRNETRRGEWGMLVARSHVLGRADVEDLQDLVGRWRWKASLLKDRSADVSLRPSIPPIITYQQHKAPLVWFSLNELTTEREDCVWCETHQYSPPVCAPCLPRVIVTFHSLFFPFLILLQLRDKLHQCWLNYH